MCFRYPGHVGGWVGTQEIPSPRKALPTQLPVHPNQTLKLGLIETCVYLCTCVYEESTLYKFLTTCLKETA